MSDCKIALITEDLRAALDGKPLTIAGETVNTKCELQRSIYDSQGERRYIELCGPWPETLEHAGNRTDHVKLNYIIELHLNDISDRPPADPITKATNNVGSDLVKMVMAPSATPPGYTRGGNALITNFEGQPGYYFTGNPRSPEFVVYAHISVEAFINADDPYLNA